MRKISDINNKKKIAIVVVGYDRLNAIQRLLNNLRSCIYVEEVPLIISIDCSNNTLLYEYVNSYHWTWGEKYVYIQKSKLGLKEHILRCGEFTNHFRGIILLEDDLYVSPFFFQYTKLALDFYERDVDIAGIALYKNEINGYAGFPAYYYNNGSDAFLFQEVCTWGQCWNKMMWDKFVDWYYKNLNFDFSSIDIPQEILNWKQAWSKFYLAYMICTNRYFLYPQISLSTNCNDNGIHVDKKNNKYQVQFLCGEKEYKFYNYERMTKYDVFLSNLDLYAKLNLSEKELSIDFYGLKSKTFYRKYLLTCKELNFKVVKSFDLSYRPIEQNILLDIEGYGIYLYDTSIERRFPKKYISLFDYFYNGINPGILNYEMRKLIKSMISRFYRKL